MKNLLKKILTLLLSVSILLLLSTESRAEKPGGPAGKKGTPPPTGVMVAEAKKEAVREIVSVVGSVESPRISRIGSEVEGLVEEIFLGEGDLVKTGQTLIQLSNSQLKISLAEAVAEKEESHKKLLELMAGSRPQEIEKAKGGMKEAEALWKKAAKEHTRYEKLFKDEVIDERLLTNSQLEAVAAERVFLQRKSSYELALEGTRKEVIAMAEAAVNVKKAKVSLLRDKLKKTSITSPFDGVVAEKFVEKGEWVTLGQQVFRVLQIHPLWVTLPVPESVVSQVHSGTEVSLEMDAFPERVFTAKVFQVIPEANKGSRTYPVRLLLKNPDRLLKVGMMAKGFIPYGKERQALMIPQDAVTVSQGRKNVFVVDAKNTAKAVPVQTGVLQKGFIEVKGDLKPGDLVVTRGGERLRPGMSLKILNPVALQLTEDKQAGQGK